MKGKRYELEVYGMENLTNKQLVEKLEMIAGQLALAESFEQPRKEKQYEKQLLQIEAEILKWMES